MNRLKTIDAARGLAEFWVLAFHALLYVQAGSSAGVIGGPCPAPENPANIQPALSKSTDNWIKPYLTPLACGDLGVAVFFVVSGFCIHWPAARAGNDFQFRLGHYCKRRFWRLYPTHLVAVIGSILIAHWLWWWIQSSGLGNCVKVPWSAFIAHFFMLQAQIPSCSLYTYCYNPNLWSLETEFQLYACYIVLLPIGRRIGWGRLLLCCLAISLAWHRYMNWQRLGYEYLWPTEACAIGHLFSWSVGAFIAESICRRTDPTKVLAWSAFIMAMTNITIPFETRPLVFMSAALATAWLLWNLCRRESLLGLTFPGCDWLGWWGHRSYSLYLWHAPILRVFIILATVQARWIRDNFYYGYGLALVASIASLYVARFSYWAVERHFISAPSKEIMRLRRADEPSAPTLAIPGTREKIAVMEERMLAGQQLWHRRDASIDLS
jgi:peptidoglycan/LPS O-acetylase OafA/YrhL